MGHLNKRRPLPSLSLIFSQNPGWINSKRSKLATEAKLFKLEIILMSQMKGIHSTIGKGCRMTMLQPMAKARNNSSTRNEILNLRRRTIHSESFWIARQTFLPCSFLTLWYLVLGFLLHFQRQLQQDKHRMEAAFTKLGLHYTTTLLHYFKMWQEFRQIQWSEHCNPITLRKTVFRNAQTTAFLREPVPQALPVQMELVVVRYWCFRVPLHYFPWI